MPRKTIAKKKWQGKAHGQKALVIEDVRSAEKHFRKHGVECDRLTHTEALSGNHEITKKLKDMEYNVLWISTPEDWHCRHQKAVPKMRNLVKWITLAITSNMLVMLFGIPGYFWKLAEIKEAVQEHSLFEHRVHLCHFGLHYDKAPTASYFKIATNSTAKFAGKCTCKVDKKKHVLDWWGREEQRAEWR